MFLRSIDGHYELESMAITMPLFIGIMMSILLVLLTLTSMVMAAPPTKYAKDSNGVMKLNPAYEKWQRSQVGGRMVTPPPNNIHQAKPMAVVTNMDDYSAYNQISGKTHALADSTASTMEMMKDSDYACRVGMNSGQIIDRIGAVFSKYEVPIGLMNKLTELQNFDVIEFIVDDSGSMSLTPDTRDAYGRLDSRWQEAIARIKSMLEVLSYFPTNEIVIKFLNRHERMRLMHRGEPPQQFFAMACAQLDQITARSPSGGTPALEKLTESLQSYGSEARVVRYFFGDGVPDCAKTSIPAIARMVIGRRNPHDNPLTWMSCSDKDEDVKWMKEVEEVAPFCAECDDFLAERAEVLEDQGDALPYTYGFYLVSQLVAAMNPDDLDAMDESVPLTKTMLDNLLGLAHSLENYRYYYDHFLRAQGRRRVESGVDRVKVTMNWAPLRSQFETSPLSKTIPAVADFKLRLQNALMGANAEPVQFNGPYQPQLSGTTSSWVGSNQYQQQPYGQQASVYQSSNLFAPSAPLPVVHVAQAQMTQSSYYPVDGPVPTNRLNSGHAYSTQSVYQPARQPTIRQPVASYPAEHSSKKKGPVAQFFSSLFSKK